ncbi:MAG TPA: hypothetical protein RMH85_11755 [Polyangiaceae bacterium LLY-WYZ-15_(1-7)]|nr:hypothetical protein [Myxococcales bacterium]MAT25602.1 hypothetical protein [Sandaracinus sp.]HJK90025.1 hypothetical protein [Polyangiaceae bacterium LLY-WYZ-15_(1-7)]HJL01785.1 hypothetical protein [Polyangiaceae bacterium LLY-WYZ-15_(1-7)]HJL09171.1 hypothetical protein [Polyangiaceae bacterium LLY-WYZ-15_(1-7)]
MRPAAAFLALLPLFAAGCLRSANPCPPGLRPDESQDRCVGPDAGVEADAGPDAPGARDDGGSDWGSDAGPLCVPDDVAAWRAIHLGDALVAEVTRCSESGCRASPCDVGGCLADAAGLAPCDACACRDCARAETDCAADRCASACTNGTDLDCRRCLCEAGCIAAFERCARRDTGICEGAFGRDASAEELRLATPIVFRRKSATGFSRAAPFFFEEPARVEARDAHHAIGWTALASFAVAGVDYLFEHMDDCPEVRCPARVAPVLADGTLGRPVWEARWGRGFDVFTPFRLGGATYLLAYKSGTRPAEIEQRGAGRIVRFAPTGEGPDLEAEVVFDAAWSPSIGPTWSHVRAFAFEGDVHLLQYRGGERHAVEVVQVREESGALRFREAAPGLAWGPDWDVLETFPVGSGPAPRWFVLQYAGQRGDTPPRVEVSAWARDDAGELVQTLPLLAAEWPDALVAVHPFRSPTATYLLRRAPSRADVDVLRLDGDPAAWADAPGEVVATRRWGAFPPWDLVTIAGARLWETP